MTTIAFNNILNLLETHPLLPVTQDNKGFFTQFPNYPTPDRLGSLKGRVRELGELGARLTHAETHRNQDRLIALAAGVGMAVLLAIAVFGFLGSLPMSLPIGIAIAALIVFFCVGILSGNSLEGKSELRRDMVFGILRDMVFGIPRFMVSHLTKERTLQREINSLREKIKEDFLAIDECLQKTLPMLKTSLQDLVDKYVKGIKEAGLTSTKLHPSVLEELTSYRALLAGINREEPFMGQVHKEISEIDDPSG